MNLEARLAALEERLAALECCPVAVILEDGEEWETVRDRLQGSGGVIVVRRILTFDEWNARAPQQQRELIEAGSVSCTP